MRRNRIWIAAALSLLLAGTGCQYAKEHPSTTTGAGVGAATGAVAGALLGENVQSTVVGGLLGALAGGLIGHYAYENKGSRTEAAKKYGYSSSQGTVLRLESAAAEPPVARPGETVDLKATYSVLTPNPGTPVDVREVREIRHDGELVGKPEVTVSRVDGTYTSTVPLQLPPTATKGSYSVTTTVETAGASDSTETTFRVE